MKKQPISFEAQKQGQNILITANYPDGEEKTVTIFGDDIRAICHCSPKVFMEEMSNEQGILEYLFDLVNSLQIAS